MLRRGQCGTSVQFTVWTMRDRLVTLGRIRMLKNRPEVSTESSGASPIHLHPPRVSRTFPKHQSSGDQDHHMSLWVVSDSKPSSGSLGMLSPHHPESSLSPLRFSLLFVMKEGSWPLCASWAWLNEDSLGSFPWGLCLPKAGSFCSQGVWPQIWFPSH